MNWRLSNPNEPEDVSYRYSHMSESYIYYIQTNLDLSVRHKNVNIDFQQIIRLYLFGQNTNKSIGQTNFIAYPIDYLLSTHQRSINTPLR